MKMPGDAGFVNGINGGDSLASGGRAPYPVPRPVNRPESKYVEKKSYLSRYAHERLLAERESPARLQEEFSDAWFRRAKEELPKFIPFLTKECGVEFRGRVLEIGAGGAWLSAELSKQPRVVEVIATDLSPRLLKEQAPKV